MDVSEKNLRLAKSKGEPRTMNFKSIPFPRYSVFFQRKGAALALYALALVVMPRLAGADTSAFTIKEDPELSKVIEKVRAAYLADQEFDRFDVVVLLPEPDGSWRRGGVNAGELSYPASCVKLAFLAAAMKWSRENGHPYEHLEKRLRPMIVVSDNVAAGHVVDAITGAPNDETLTTLTDRFREWEAKRRYIERQLDARGLLGRQVVLHKTFPSNSGENPSGAEKFSRDMNGMNRMEPRLAASLMLEIVKGAWEPEAKDYMLSLLTRDRFDSQCYAGCAMPPGTVVASKAGVAYDTLEDIAWIQLPNGKEFVTAFFSNGWDRNRPAPHDATHAGTFYEALLPELGLEEGLPPILRLEESAQGATATGAWREGETVKGMHGGAYKAINASAGGGASFTWKIEVPEPGMYEVSVWAPRVPNAAADAPLRIRHANGEETLKINQAQAPGRWVKVGDYPFRPGEGEITLTNQSADSSKVIVADAIKLAKWPEALKPAVFATPAPQAESSPAAASTTAQPAQTPSSASPGEWETLIENGAPGAAYRQSGEWKEIPEGGFRGQGYAIASTEASALAIWVAELPDTADYEVAVFVPEAADLATATKYEVRARDGTRTIPVDHTQNANRWVVLGTFPFRQGAAAVALDALASTGGKFVAADALRFRRAAPAPPATPEGETPEASARPVHVHSITPSVQIERAGGRKGRVNVEVRDSADAQVKDVQVTVTFLGDFNETLTGTTNDRGLAVLFTSEAKTGSLKFSVCVDSLRHVRRVHNPGADVVSCKNFSFRD